ncbi:MAG: macro domain-containing protein [Saprospiraceae bacterium]|nr:macro domain-containing protein [Saprospiraceae bacterium]
MIKEITGDILMSDSKTIIQSVAPMDHFDHGLALSLRELYPSMVKDFRHYCKIQNPKPGEIWAWGGVGSISIVNLLCQESAENSRDGHPGKASLSYVDHALKDLAKWVKKENIDRFAIPKIATGVGGLEWEDVRSSIYKNFESVSVNVFIYSVYKRV